MILLTYIDSIDSILLFLIHISEQQNSLYTAGHSYSPLIGLLGGSLGTPLPAVNL